MFRVVNGYMINAVLIVNSLLLGLRLAMDAFSVSLANGLNEPHMKKRRMCLIALVYALFQYAMPVIGWQTSALAWTCRPGKVRIAKCTSYSS